MKMGIRKLDEHPKIKTFFAMMLDATTAIVDRHQHAGPGLGRERHYKIFNDDVCNSIFSMNVCQYLGANLTRCKTSDVFKKSVAKDMANNHPNSVLEHMDDENGKDDTYNYTLSILVFFAGLQPSPTVHRQTGLSFEKDNQ